jgi:hypothetical protein
MGKKIHGYPQKKKKKHKKNDRKRQGPLTHSVQCCCKSMAPQMHNAKWFNMDFLNP